MTRRESSARAPEPILFPQVAICGSPRNDCPKCAAPAGSPCRTRGGKTAAKYHIPRFIPVPVLRSNSTSSCRRAGSPGSRGPGTDWRVITGSPARTRPPPRQARGHHPGPGEGPS
ncbi:zinc finger domain-containing protein [Streptomyces hebeiensis]